jgi:RNA polymerase sigma-70 factor (ECF subfamily)
VRDDAWFEGVFSAHSTAVYRYFRRRAALDDAEDLTADVLATAWRRREDVPEGAELPWLYRTAGFVLANHRRKGRPVPVEDVPEEVDDADPAQLAVIDDDLRAVLTALSPRDRRILLLHAWEGLDGDQLAAALGIGRGGADAALSRARARLRQVWADRDASEGAGTTQAR